MQDNGGVYPHVAANAITQGLGEAQLTICCVNQPAADDEFTEVTVSSWS